MNVTCSFCDATIELPDTWAGRRARCRGCGQTFTVPMPTTPSPPPQSPPAESSASPTPSTPSASPPSPWWRSRRFFIGAGVGLVSVYILVGLLVSRPWHTEPPTPVASTPSAPPVAILEPTEIETAPTLRNLLHEFGFRITGGEHNIERNGYIYTLSPIHVAGAFCKKDRLIVSWMFFWKGDQSDAGLLRELRAWNGMNAILSRFLPAMERANYRKWIAASLHTVAKDPVGSDGFVSERAFDGVVVRAQYFIADSRMTLITVARAYAPWHELKDGRKPPKRWRDLRKGMTLPEIEAFAGRGTCKLRMGSGENLTERYDFRGGRGVFFTNGRADSWVL